MWQQLEKTQTVGEFLKGKDYCKYVYVYKDHELCFVDYSSSIPDEIMDMKICAASYSSQSYFLESI